MEKSIKESLGIFENDEIKEIFTDNNNSLTVRTKKGSLYTPNSTEQLTKVVKALNPSFFTSYKFAKSLINEILFKQIDGDLNVIKNRHNNKSEEATVETLKNLVTNSVDLANTVNDKYYKATKQHFFDIPEKVEDPNIQVINDVEIDKNYNLILRINHGAIFGTIGSEELYKKLQLVDTKFFDRIGFVYLLKEKTLPKSIDNHLSFIKRLIDKNKKFTDNHVCDVKNLCSLAIKTNALITAKSDVHVDKIMENFRENALGNVTYLGTRGILENRDRFQDNRFNQDK